jgi:hypothetical protein
MIQFSKDLNLNKLRMAFNNDVVTFWSTGSLLPLYADVIISSQALRLYPDPENRFYINLKPYVQALMNTRNFEDTLQPSIAGGFAGDYIFDFTAGSYLDTDVKFTITLSDNTTETFTAHTLTWFAGVEQLNDYNTLLKTEPLVLSPFKRHTANHYYLKYWEGYPFDLSLYCPGTVINLKNDTTLLEQDFDVAGKVSRIVFSDGRTDETLEAFFPLTEGHNSIRIMASAEATVNDKFLTLEKIPYRHGVYLKWLNKYGGYSYWLFEDTYSVDRSTKQLGELDRDLNNLEDSFGRAIQMGKESQDSIRVIAELLTEEERVVVEGLLDSPKIYLFTGRPLSQNGRNSWVEVSLKTSGSRIKNARQPLTNFTFDLELPQRFTQVL